MLGGSGATPDVDAAAGFYGSCSAGRSRSWRTRPNWAATGGRKKTVPTSPERSPLMQEGQPSVWASYVAVEDADATAAR